MALTDEKLTYLLMSAALAVTLYMLGFFHNMKEPDVWSKLETVGLSHRGPFPWFRAIASSILSTRENATKGYNQISKKLRLPFALPTTWTGRTVVMLPPSMLHKVLTRPDNLTESKIANIFGLIQTIQLPYIIKDPDIYMNALHFDVVRKKMSKKDMHRFAPMTWEENDLAFSDIWGTLRNWRTINGWDACGQVIARSAERMMIGLPGGRDEKLLEASRLYANSVLLGGAVMNCFPPCIRWFTAPLIALRAKYYQSRTIKLLVPIIEERIRIYMEYQDGEDTKESEHVPEDFLQWLVTTCAKDENKNGPLQLIAPQIANRLIALMTPLIFAVVYIFAHSVLDLYRHPDKEEVLHSLETECKNVSGQYNGLDSSEAVNSLFRVDSTIRESMRLSDVSVASLFRDVTEGEYDLGNGVVIPPGVRFGFPTQNIHLDASNYSDPLTFDPFRFVRRFESMGSKTVKEKSSERELIVTPTQSFLALGYGRHACPGRWYAALVMKQALAYIILNYDVELIGKPVLRKSLLNTMVPPVNAQMRIRRNSQGSLHPEMS